jgi:hypothetical protein
MIEKKYNASNIPHRKGFLDVMASFTFVAFVGSYE